MESILNNIIKKYACLFDYMELRSEETQEFQIKIFGELKESLNKKFDKGGCLRVLKNGIWGFVSFNDLTNVDHLLNKMAKNLNKSSGDIGINLCPSITDRVELDIINDPRMISEEDKLQVLLKYNNLALSYSKYIISTETKYNEKFTKTYYINSEGTDLYQEKMDLNGSVVITAKNDNIVQTTNVDFGSSNDFNVIYGLESKIIHKCQIASDLLFAPSVKSGVYPVVLDPRLTSVFIHESFGHLSEADDLSRSDELISLFQNGNKIGNEFINVYDSGYITGSRGNVKYDDEGVRATKVYLIQNGMISGRLHSRETAFVFDEEVTGNARALSYKYKPLCRMRNTCLEKGPHNLTDMIKSINYGIYALGATGGQTNGIDFTFTCEYAYIIEEGNIKELIRPVTLHGDVFSTIKNIEMIGDDVEYIEYSGGCGKYMQFPLPVSCYAPHIKISSIQIGGN